MTGATARQGDWSEFNGTPPGAAAVHGARGHAGAARRSGQPGVGGAVGKASLVSATQAGNRQGQGQPDQPRPASQRFAVRQNDLAAVARPGAASYATAPNVLAQ